MITIMDIAKRSGFSRSTVSRVLTNNPNVKPETRERIKEVLQELNYQNNEVARNLALRTPTRIVLFIVADMFNSFHTSLIKEISDLLEVKGLMTVVCNGEFNAKKQLHYLNMAYENRFAGIIMMGMETPDITARIKSMHCPVVLINCRFKGVSLDTVLTDAFGSAYSGTKYLIEHGHRKICHLAGPSRSYTYRELREGYIAALRDAGIKQDERDIYEHELNWHLGYKFANRLSEYTAIIISSYRLMNGFERGWSELKRRIPEDLSVVYVGGDYSYEMTLTKMTGLIADPALTARYATELLLTRMENMERPQEIILSKSKLLKGESVRTVSEKHREISAVGV